MHCTTRPGGGGGRELWEMGYNGIPLPSLPIDFLLLQGFVLMAETQERWNKTGFCGTRSIYNLGEPFKGSRHTQL